MAGGEQAEGSIWFYAPNKGAAIFFTIAFFATGIVHLWQAVRYHSWRLTGLYVLCAAFYTGGFIARVLGAFDYKNIIKYILSVVLSYAAPPLYELGNYYILGRILYFVPHCSPIHPGRVLTTFAALSSVVEALNAAGAAYVANPTLPQKLQNIGHTLFKVALILQLVVIALFVTLATTFYNRCRKAGINHVKVNQPLLVLYISSGLILTRTIYRTVEYFKLASVNVYVSGLNPDAESPIIRYEFFFYIFEATLMLANSILLNVRHPRRWLPQSTKVYLAKDGITEIMGPGYKEDRNVVATLFDPFDMYGIIKGRDKATKFWDEQPESHNMTASPGPLAGQTHPEEARDVASVERAGGAPLPAQL
ncbi:RTA1 like protein-domain-containing protein [Xylaria intraflava]|nr:RTA1 like protein-domain-containing protein [Xylaria intraflava]